MELVWRESDNSEKLKTTISIMTLLGVLKRKRAFKCRRMKLLKKFSRLSELLC